MKKITSKSEAQTRQIALQIGQKLSPPSILCLYGDLGSGKTVFTKGIAKALGIPEREIKSPTYTLVREYKTKKLHFYHFDFYRIEALDDLMLQNLQEIFQQPNAIIVIEWPERLKEALPAKRLDLKFEYINENSRQITII